MTNDTVIRQALEQADFDEVRAAEILRVRLESDLDLLRTFVGPYLEQAIRRELRRMAGPAPSRHQPSRLAPEGDGLDAAHGLFLVARANLQDLLEEYRLACGTALGDARRDQVLEELRERRSAAADHLVHVQFLGRVASAVTGSCRVRDVLSNSALRQLMAQSREEVGR